MLLPGPVQQVGTAALVLALLSLFEISVFFRINLLLGTLALALECLNFTFLTQMYHICTSFS